MKIKKSELRNLINESLAKNIMSENLYYHKSQNKGVDKNIFRPGSKEFFSLFKEARSLYQQGLYNISECEKYYIEDLDIGEFGTYEGRRVPLDFPIEEGYEHLVEAEYKGKKVELNKPKKIKGGGGRAYVYVRNDKGNVIKVKFGSSMPDAMGDSPAAKKRRKSFGDRHRCSDKKDKTKAGYWSCRATKFFGRNVSGWW